eukprot:813919-Pyramimonas_sp.AAC.1
MPRLGALRNERLRAARSSFLEEGMLPEGGSRPRGQGQRGCRCEPGSSAPVRELGRRCAKEQG